MRPMDHPMRAAALFAGWDETMIQSCLHGVMGHVYTNDTYTAAVAVLGDFAFFAGQPDATLLPDDHFACSLLVPQSEAWTSLLQAKYGSHAALRERYAFRKDDRFDRAQLRQLATIPAGCTLKMIDCDLFCALRRESWSRDLTANYPDFAAFQSLGLGVVLLSDGRIAAGASSYSSYPGGIEIEIDTRPDLRRRGYATVCAANLILACLDRGLYPSWDAHTRISKALAEKLGYAYSHSYPCLEVTVHDDL